MAQKCLSLLLLARQFDQESYEAMATALREMNPHLALRRRRADAIVAEPLRRQPCNVDGGRPPLRVAQRRDTTKLWSRPGAGRN